MKLKQLRKVGVFLVLLTAFIIPIISSAQTLLGDSLISKLDKGVLGFKDRYHSPSVILLIVHNKDIIYSNAAGYTDIDRKIPATADSWYPVLSLTKLFTSTMLMQLVQRNRVHLEDDVTKYLPQFQQSIAFKERRVTTLLQLASHASGLPRNTPADIGFTRQVDSWLLGGSKDTVISSSTDHDFLQSLKIIKYEYPKYQFLGYSDRHYSNLGFSVLGMALERAAKTDYAKYIINNIFLPLNMTNSGFIKDPKPKVELAKGYFYDDIKKELIQTPFFQPNSALAAGGMFTTGNDLAKFVSFQFADGSAYDNKILSEDYRQ